jgi:hypothetical protein
MTQMMLFDTGSLTAAPVAATGSLPTATAAASAITRVASPKAGYRDADVSAARAATPAPPRRRTLPPAAGEDGVQHMGDLARLVLLRYQLVAQRRQALAARQGSGRHEG